MVEVWISLDIMGFPNYEISSTGRLCQIKRNYYLKGTVIASGYIRAYLTNADGVPEGKLIHVLVATAFYGPPAEGMTVDHIDRDRANNNMWNLRWATKSEQCRNKSSYTHAGRPVCQYDANGTLIRKWDKIKDAAIALNLTHGNISTVCKTGYRCGGYFWKYFVETYDNEEWREHPFEEFEPLLVSSHGRIHRPSGKITYGSNVSGYLSVTMYDIETSDKVTVRVNRLVAATFLGRNDDLQVNHKDGNKTNNRIENLEYTTNQQNSIHAVKSGLRSYDKIAFERKVVQLTEDGTVVKIHDSIIKAFQETGISRGNISTVCGGKRPRAGGYVWRYAEE